MDRFFMYILKCADDSYYVGHTDNLEKRLSEHRLATYHSYTSTRLPVELVYHAPIASRYEAIAAERKIKRWTRAKKEALMAEDWEKLNQLGKKKF